MCPAHDKHSLMVVLVLVRIGLKANWSRQKRDQLTLVASEFQECALLAVLGMDAQMMASWPFLPPWGGSSLGRLPWMEPARSQQFQAVSLHLRHSCNYFPFSSSGNIPGLFASSWASHSDSGQVCQTHIRSPWIARAAERRAVLWRTASISLTRRKNRYWMGKNNKCPSQKVILTYSHYYLPCPAVSLPQNCLYF